MEKVLPPQEVLPQLLQWSSQGLSEKDIQQRLLSEGWNATDVTEVLKAFRKHCFEKKRTVGFMCCGAGGGLLLLSFLITLLLFDTNHNFAVYLYGLTFLGITIVMKGMVDILGW